MSWNYRVVKRTYEKETEYAIYEAYYEEDLEVPSSITVEPVSPTGETKEELESAIGFYIRALELPVLNYEDF